MIRRRLMLTFPFKLATEPIIYNLGQQFRLVTCICRAEISTDRGWLEIEVEGDADDVDESIIWLTGKGVRVGESVGNSAEQLRITGL
jgi:L-aspartate semialdehyde sulfurtransferase ferredoxin